MTEETEVAAKLDKSDIIKRESIKDGLYMGGLNVAFSLVCWLINPVLLMTMRGADILVKVIPFVLLCYFLFDIRKKVGNYWSFAEVMRACFFMFMISGMLFTAWIFIRFHFLDPTLAKRFSDISLKKVTEMLTSMGVTRYQIEDSLAKLKPEDLDPSSTGSLIKAFFTELGFWMVVSLVMAAIFKKRKPAVVAGS